MSLDDRPLAEPTQVLGQVGTTERPTGLRTKPAKVSKDQREGEEIVNFGKASWQIVGADVTLTIRNSALNTAVVRDVNFMPLRKIELSDAEGGKQVKLPADALYVVLK
ncbi:MAG: hypothetical protein M5U26_22890 [Planctomycetota bacterium]|nr:hypothetical protein [Planctomycetota bacterium]